MEVRLSFNRLVAHELMTLLKDLPPDTQIWVENTVGIRYPAKSFCTTYITQEDLKERQTVLLYQGNLVES